MKHEFDQVDDVGDVDATVTFEVLVVETDAETVDKEALDQQSQVGDVDVAVEGDVTAQSATWGSVWLCAMGGRACLTISSAGLHSPD